MNQTNKISFGRTVDDAIDIGSYTTNLIIGSQSIQVSLNKVVKMKNGMFNAIVYDDVNYEGCYCNINMDNKTIHLMATAGGYKWSPEKHERSISFIQFDPGGNAKIAPPNVGFEMSRRKDKTSDDIIATWKVISPDEISFNDIFLKNIQVIEMSYQTGTEIHKNEKRKLKDHRIINHETSPVNSYKVDLYFEKIEDGQIINIEHKPSFHIQIEGDGKCSITQTKT